MPNEDFAVQFAPGARREPCQLYLISPPAIDEPFAGRLASALDAGAVAAFQLRLTGIDEHVITRAAQPLQRFSDDLDVAFIINYSMNLAKRLGADGVQPGPGGA